MTAKKKAKIAAPKRTTAKPKRDLVIAGTISSDKLGPSTPRAAEWMGGEVIADYRGFPLWERVGMWMVLAVILVGVFFW